LPTVNSNRTKIIKHTYIHSSQKKRMKDEELCMYAVALSDRELSNERDFSIPLHVTHLDYVHTRTRTQEKDKPKAEKGRKREKREKAKGERGRRENGKRKKTQREPQKREKKEKSTPTDQTKHRN